NKTITGIHAADIVKLSRLLSKEKGVTMLTGLAKRQFAPALLHAAAFENNFGSIALIGPYSSYRSMVENPVYSKDFLFTTVAASVGEYDLPDLAASLAPRKLLIADITDGNGSMLNIADIEKDLKVIRAGYKNCPANLKIIRAESENIQQSLSNWLLSK
ncbi:MAG TPA: hypothetical protein VGD31_11810, partial [Sphingobacteriaceae bacterium]